MKFPAPDSFTRHAACPVAGRPLSDLERIAGTKAFLW